jgi:hypothetical protein|tara:strand:+ start:669 stop:986 length:318 start_codon:yes stop_codon:yes gene_type:complete
MRKYENYSWIIWPVVFLLFIIILTNSCTSQTLPPIQLEEPPTVPFSYNIVDNNNIEHRYFEDIFNLNLPQDNLKLTQMCNTHAVYEKITVIRNSKGTSYIIGVIQ